MLQDKAFSSWKGTYLREQIAKKENMIVVSTFSQKQVNLLTNVFRIKQSNKYWLRKVLKYYDYTKHYVDDFNHCIAKYYYDY